MVGWYFGRLGCTLAHDHLGGYTDFMLAVHFPDGPRHDLGWYEWLYTVGLTLLVFCIRRKPVSPGVLVGLVSCAYAPVRFGLDFLRVEDIRYGGLTPGQYFSVALLVFGIRVLVTRRHTRVWYRRRRPIAVRDAGSILGRKAITRRRRCA
jgi:phosphatidylglycerol:prolipoprotein diacylglycerol transferase